jgi:hypothetical protein
MYHIYLCVYCRDDFVQFSRLCVDIGPSYVSAKQKVISDKKAHLEELERRRLLQQNKRNRETAKVEAQVQAQVKETVAEDVKTEEVKKEINESDNFNSMMKAGLAEEYAKRQKKIEAAAKRREARENAWLYAHQHLYIKVPGKEPYCVVCRECKYNLWVESKHKEEEQWKKDFEEILLDIVEAKETEVKARIEADFLIELEKKHNAIRKTKTLSSMKVIGEQEGDAEDDHEEDNKGCDGEPDKKENDGEVDDDEDIKKSIKKELKSDPILSNDAIEVSRSVDSKVECNTTDIDSSLKESPSSTKEVIHKKERSPSMTSDSSLIKIPSQQPIIEIDPPEIIILSVMSKLIENVEKRIADEKQKVIDDANALKSKLKRDKMAKYDLLPDFIKFAKLPPVDATGQDIALVLGTEEIEIKMERERLKKEREEQKRKEEEERSKKASLDISVKTVFDEFNHEILLKFWNVEFGEKADFLGCVTLPQSVLLNPAKGVRAYLLQTDAFHVRPGREKLQLHGSVFLKLAVTKYEDMRVMSVVERLGTKKEAQLLRTQSSMGLRSIMSSRNLNLDLDEKEPPSTNIAETGKSVSSLKGGESSKEKKDADYMLPSQWRLQIIRATRMTSLDSKEKNSPMCEVCWRGMMIKRTKVEFMDDFVKFGETSVQKNTLDPNWGDDPSAVFELPPIWTDSAIPGRGAMGAPLMGGGWVSRNNIPEDDIGDGKNKPKGSLLARMNSKAKSDANIAATTSTTTVSVPDFLGTLEKEDSSRLNITRSKLADPKGLLKKAITAVVVTTKLASHEIPGLSVCTYILLCRLVCIS